MTARVALIGANGYGLVHRKAMASMPDPPALVALCDLAPVRDEPGAPVPPGAAVFTDYRELLAATAVDVAIIATPPHTHLEIATAAARAGADLLLEKPPVMSMAEHDTLAEQLAVTSRICQVGFQALGSAALAELTATVTGGALGRVHAVSAVGAWQRPDGYYLRAAWAGRRSVNGRPSLDGALANPFAHAIMQCLAVAEAAAGTEVRAVGIELERYRARPIQVDDTAVVRVRLAHGPPVVVAVTLCADKPEEPNVIVHAERGRAVLGYTSDQLQLPGEAAREVPGRTSLLANLLAYRRDPNTALLAPLARTRPFTQLVEAIAAAPEPSTIGDPFRAVHGAGADRVVTVPGLTGLMRQAADRLALPSELDVAWAVPPVRTTTTDLQTGTGSAMV